VSIAGVQAIVIASADPDAAAQFYRDVLGATPAGSESSSGLVLPGGVRLRLPLEDAPDARELVVAVDDPGAARDRLQRLGVELNTRDGCLVVTDERVASGELAIVPGDHSGAAAPDDAAAPAGDEPRSTGVAGVEGLDHVCFVVPDLPFATAAVRALGGWPVLGGDTLFEARGVQLRFPRLKLELLTPVGVGAIGSFLAKRGGRAGMQHMTFLVRDVDAAVQALHALGFGTVGTETSSAGWHEAFIRPRHTDQFVVQLARTPHHHVEPLADDTLQAVLAGHFQMSDNRMQPMPAATSSDPESTKRSYGRLT
jgi:catechol 2,3-dioxygenase-like lactoylglutathione lyase family enzyme